MRRLILFVTLAAIWLSLGACSQVRPESAVVLASEVSADLVARYNVGRVVFKYRIENACVYEAHQAVPDEYIDRLFFMARDRNGCATLDRPFVRIASNDHSILALVQRLAYGDRKGEFVQALKDKSQWDAWDVIQGLEKDTLNGTFLPHEDGTLMLVVPGGVNTSVHITSTDPLQFTIGRWQ